MPLRTLRPRDAQGVYRHPRVELARLARAGSMLRLAEGYYVVVPDDRGPEWRPAVEAAAAGIASAVYGHRKSVLTGISAARVHGAVPRALDVVTVAVPTQHRPVVMTGLGGAVVHFIKRDTERLEARLETLGDLGQALVTTPEQTALDLARARNHWVDDQQVLEALHNLVPMCDPTALHELAGQQRLRTALARLGALVR